MFRGCVKHCALAVRCQLHALHGIKDDLVQAAGAPGRVEKHREAAQVRLGLLRHRFV